MTLAEVLAALDEATNELELASNQVGEHRQVRIHAALDDLGDVLTQTKGRTL